MYTLGPQKKTYTFLEVFMVHNLVLRWPKPLFFMVLGAYGINTPQMFNIDPEMRPSQKESHSPTIIFQGLCSFAGV